MSLFARRTSEKVGLPPGELVHVGERKTDATRIAVVDYDETHYEEREVASGRECDVYLGKPTTTWVNVDGLHDVEAIAEIGSCFGAHPLVLEDIVNTAHRPKAEDLGDYLFVVVKMFDYDRAEDEILVEQVSLLLGGDHVVSFQERQGDVFDPVRERLKNGRGRIRKEGPDYLAYTLIDAVVDNYFVVLEHLGEQIEGMEEELIERPTTETLEKLHRIKRHLILLRKSVWPLREVISLLQRGESPLIREGTLIYLRDLYDHTIQVIDTVETFRDMVSGMLDIYLSSISNRMNEVMKVLTVIATIFIPLTFIAGIYGMNFAYMPELQWHWSYPVLLAVIVVLGVSMLVVFRRKRWV